MNVKISVLKKDGGKFEQVVDFNPALMSLGETVQGVLESATFHEWANVLVEFDYKEKGEYTKEQEDEAEKEYQESETRKAIDAKFNEGIPADSVAFTKPPVFS